MCVYVYIFVYHRYIFADLQQQLKWHRDDLWAYRTTMGNGKPAWSKTKAPEAQGEVSVATSSTIRHLSQTARRYIRFFKYKLWGKCLFQTNLRKTGHLRKNNKISTFF